MTVRWPPALQRCASRLLPVALVATASLELGIDVL